MFDIMPLGEFWYGYSYLKDYLKKNTPDRIKSSKEYKEEYNRIKWIEHVTDSKILYDYKTNPTLEQISQFTKPEEYRLTQDFLQWFDKMRKEQLGAQEVPEGSQTRFSEGIG